MDGIDTKSPSTNLFSPNKKKWSVSHSTVCSVVRPSLEQAHCRRPSTKLYGKLKDYFYDFRRFEDSKEIARAINGFCGCPKSGLFLSVVTVYGISYPAKLLKNKNLPSVHLLIEPPIIYVLLDEYVTYQARTPRNNDEFLHEQKPRNSLTKLPVRRFILCLNRDLHQDSSSYYTPV